MICAIYRSPKKDQTFLYVEKRDDFSKVPPALLQSFGEPKLVTLLNLAGRERLANADIVKVKQGLTELGFYLQMPAQQEDWLAEHRAWLEQESL